MIREKLFVISSVLDESIKAQTPVYDVSLFRSFIDFEEYIEGTPIIISTLVVSTEELPFNNSNMTRLLQAIESPFLQITGSIIYVIGEDYSRKVVEQFLSGSGINKYAIYQGKIDVRYMTDIVTGEARETQEQQVYEMTYRIRAKDYVSQAERISEAVDLDADYENDEDEMKDIPDEEEPEEVLPSSDYDTNIHYIAGENREERTVLSFLIGQYLSLNGKAVLIEHDKEYHTLTEFVTKANLSNTLVITINEIYANITDVIRRIKNAPEHLIVITAVDRIDYDYNYLFTLLYSNLRTFVSDMIMECDFDEVPYGVDVIYVCQNTVPDVLRMTMSIKQAVDVDRTKFIGLQMHDIAPIDLTTKEYIAIISAVLNKNDVFGEVVYANSIKLKGDKTAYDICSIITT